MVESKYFKENEFQRCTPSCSLQDMKRDFMLMLDRAREISGIPFALNSAYRSVEHERKMGRSGASAHTLGCAADVRCGSDGNRFLIVEAAIKAGFTRIGVAKTFVHLDNSASHTQKVVWTY